MTKYMKVLLCLFVCVKGMNNLNTDMTVRPILTYFYIFISSKFMDKL